MGRKIIENRPRCNQNQDSAREIQVKGSETSMNPAYIVVFFQAYEQISQMKQLIEKAG